MKKLAVFFINIFLLLTTTIQAHGFIGKQKATSTAQLSDNTRSVERFVSQSQLAQENDTLPSQPLTLEEAKQVALAVFPGRILKTDFGSDIFYIYVLHGIHIREVYVHRLDGTILNVDTTNIPLVLGGVSAVVFGIIITVRKNHRKAHSNS